MQIQLIRNATLRMYYAQETFVIDPYLAEKHTLPSFSGTSPNPMVDLPCTPREVIADIEMAVVSHLHSDHFDTSAQQLLPKNMTIFCQPGDESDIESMGFSRVLPVNEKEQWGQITISRTAGQHGSGEVLNDMGSVAGFVFQAEGEPVVYWAGDTIWYKDIEETIQRVKPDIIITHSCGAVWGDNVFIVMDEEQTVGVCHAAPNSTIVATHMEALDHATVSREALRQYADSAGISPTQFLIPADGETLSF